MTRVAVNPLSHVISAERLYRPIHFCPQHDHTHQPRATFHNNFSLWEAVSASGSGPPCTDELDHDVDLTTAPGIRSGAATSSADVLISTELTKSPAAELKSTKVLLASTQDFTVEQLTGLNSHLKKHFQSKSILITIITIIFYFIFTTRSPTNRATNVPNTCSVRYFIKRYSCNRSTTHNSAVDWTSVHKSTYCST